MYEPESPESDIMSDPRSILFILLGGTIEKDDMSEPPNVATKYFVMRTSLHSYDVICIQAGSRIYLFLPADTRVTTEDMANLKIEPFSIHADIFDIYVFKKKR